MLPIVALIGRPNVGKSTLFNRLIRSNRAITHDRPGVTRDRMYGEVRRKGAQSYTIVDTGGITLDESGAAGEGPDGIRGFESEILEQAREAVKEASVLLLVVDGKEGINPLDERLAKFLRGSSKPVLVLVNKIDGPEQADLLLSDFHVMGLELTPTSASHGYGMRFMFDRVQELLEEVAEQEEEEPEEELTESVAPEDGDEELPEEPPLPPEVTDIKFEDLKLPAGFDLESSVITEELGGGDPGKPPVQYVEQRLDERRGLRLAMLGKPNAGKSSLVNRISGTNRMIVSDVAGTTRDSVDVTFHADVGLTDGSDRHEQKFTFVDTAGVRRRTRITDQVERYSVNAALKSSQRAEVTLLVLDCEEGVTQQDKRLITFLDRYKIPFITIVNKIDLVERKERKRVLQDFRDALRFCPHVPMITTSAITGAGLEGILDLVWDIWRECGLRISTGRLNKAVQDAIQRHQPPVIKRRRAKFFYLTQAETRPPTFIMFVNDPDRIKTSYARFLESRLRKSFGLKHAPMRLVYRACHTKGKKKR